MWIGSPATLWWISAFGSRSASSAGRARLSTRQAKVSDRGPSRSSSTQLPSRPISSHVPSTSTPSGARPARIVCQADRGRPLVVLAQHVGGAHQHRPQPGQLETAARETSAGADRRPARPRRPARGRVRHRPRGCPVAPGPAGRRARPRSPRWPRSPGRRRAGRRRRRGVRRRVAAIQLSMRRSRFGLVVPRVGSPERARASGGQTRGACHVWQGNRVQLRELTTLRLGGPAARVVTASSADELVDAIGSADSAGEPVLVVGGGSNLVVSDEGWPGVVVLVRTRGHRARRGRGHRPGRRGVGRLRADHSARGLVGAGADVRRPRTDRCDAGAERRGVRQRGGRHDHPAARVRPHDAGGRGLVAAAVRLRLPDVARSSTPTGTSCSR